MKPFISLIILFCIAIGCSTQKGIVKVRNTAESNSIETDSTEYELETFDARFETWYMMHNSPSQYRAKSYYETWNRQYVAEWNYKATTGRNSFFEPIIGYEPNIDFGIDLNHKLFHYFMYVERVLKIQILSNGPYFPVF